jgi:GNAT superfamily N-acetyltransferase
MPKTAKPRIPLWQQSITSFLNAHSSVSAEKQLFEMKLKAFREQYQRMNPKQFYLGRKDKFCYYRDEEFYEYHAYDPQTGRKIGELTLDDEHFLTGIYVDAAYQRKGIGTNLLNFANITNMSAKGARLIIAVGQDYK